MTIKIKIALLVAALLVPLMAWPQTINPSTVNSQRSMVETYAVVVGISDYQDEAIPDLRFADKDAEAFAKYLRSSAGGQVPEENIKMLLNQDATMAAVAAALDWLVEQSQEGDQAIIYFSGHGDVEANTARQPGFLLTYDSPPKIYIAGAYPLFYLQLIIETLSSDKNVQTLVITDACRSGKLAGSEIGGTQATAANLAKQYANEIKVLSCQPNELSHEGEQWGGGRGAFSYHLIEGLIGLADKNEDYQVNLLELENHLETAVPEETAPESQIPMTVGNKGEKVSFVDETTLEELKKRKANQLPSIATTETRSTSESTQILADSMVMKKYDAFIAALDAGHLMNDGTAQLSADSIYQQLIQDESLAGLHNSMTRKLAVALQNDAQQAINSYLLSKPTEMEKRWKGETDYELYPRYLSRAAELLGEKHYMYDYLNAKQLYFEGLNLRMLAKTSEDNDLLIRMAVQKQEKALALEDRAAHFHNELGILLARLKSYEQAMVHYQKAIELAPKWGLPYANYALSLLQTGQEDAALEQADKARLLLEDFEEEYQYLMKKYSSKLKRE